MAEARDIASEVLLTEEEGEGVIELLEVVVVASEDLVVVMNFTVLIGDRNVETSSSSEGTDLKAAGCRRSEGHPVSSPPQGLTSQQP